MALQHANNATQRRNQHGSQGNKQRVNPPSSVPYANMSQSNATAGGEEFKSNNDPQQRRQINQNQQRSLGGKPPHSTSDQGREDCISDNVPNIQSTLKKGPGGIEASSDDESPLIKTKTQDNEELFFDANDADGDADDDDQSSNDDLIDDDIIDEEAQLELQKQAMDIN